VHTQTGAHGIHSLIDLLMPARPPAFPLFPVMLLRHDASKTPTTIFALKNGTESLDLSNTEGLVGEVPAALFNNTGLKEVDVSENPNITGVIPESVGDVASQLQTLSIGHTGMGGTIPSSLFHLNELVVFNVSGAGFHGNLSESFSNLSGLQQLALDNNRFSGPIPVAFDTLLSLKRLTLVGNKLTGTISDAICEQRGVLESDIQFLSADCDGPDPPVTCDCCSMCKPETR